MRDYNGGKDMYVSGNWHMAPQSKELLDANTMLSRLMQEILLQVGGRKEGLPKNVTNSANISPGFHPVSRSYLYLYI